MRTCIAATFLLFISSATAFSSPVTNEFKPKTIAVTGATGRTGSLVVSQLLSQGMNVVALVRDLEKADKYLVSSAAASSSSVSGTSTGTGTGTLTIQKCDLSSEQDVISCVSGAGCDSAIWCATGFSDNPDQSFLDKLMGVFGVAVTPKTSIDSVGVPALAKAFQTTNGDDNDDDDDDTSDNDNNDNGVVPKVIMLSSAGVTRPSWSESKKQTFEGCADIPIVRLNPFNILNIKADSEERLRQSGVPYTIFRPTGLNDKWPSNSRPIFSQGDVAVGRINRADAAKILVQCLSAPSATGKTFEAFSISGYPPASDIESALGKLVKDAEGPISDETLMATYSAMQQLLPGETQDAAALAMGQTYEELDEGKTGRFGVKGSEDAEAAAPKPTA